MKSEESKSYERINNQLDGTRGWVVTAACFMAAFLTDGITFCFGLILFELIQVFDEPVEKVAWIPSFLLGIQLLSGITIFNHSYIINVYNSITHSITFKNVDRSTSVRIE
jgi:hypothetical protein